MRACSPSSLPLLLPRLKTRCSFPRSHIDAAWAYQNEAEVGEGIKASGVPRSELFITTKIFVTSFFEDRLEKSLDESLSKLGTDYVDLLLLHWPVAVNPNAAGDLMPLRPDGKRDLNDKDVNTTVWPLMEQVLKTGKTKAIGVSNWSQPKLEALLKTAKVVPATNQIELHPLLPQQSLVDYCRSKGILAQAYSPLGSSGGELRDDPRLGAIAKKHGVATGNILISWSVARGVVVLPKSVTPSRIEDNIKCVSPSPPLLCALVRSC